MHEPVKLYPKENPVYVILEKKKNNQYVIERHKLPFLKLLYNSQTKKGKLYSFSRDQCLIISHIKDPSPGKILKSCKRNNGLGTV